MLLVYAVLLLCYCCTLLILCGCYKGCNFIVVLLLGLGGWLGLLVLVQVAYYCFGCCYDCIALFEVETVFVVRCLWWGVCGGVGAFTCVPWV